MFALCRCSENISLKELLEESVRYSRTDVAKRANQCKSPLFQSPDTPKTCTWSVSSRITNEGLFQILTSNHGIFILGHQHYDNWSDAADDKIIIMAIEPLTFGIVNIKKAVFFYN